MIKIGLVIIFAMWVIKMCIAPFWEDIKYWLKMRKLNKQFPCQTCENSDCVSNNSPCYSCYYKSEYKDKEDNK